MKSYAVYCSGNASRVIRFFSSEGNRERFKPQSIIYDGENETVISFLDRYFFDNYLHIRLDSIPIEYSNKRNQYISNLILENLLSRRIEYLICFGSGILKRPLIDIYNKKIINFHPALLPSFKGLNAIDQAKDAGALIVGNTAHFIDEGIDTGKIILQSAMNISESNNYEDILELQFPMLKIILRDIIGADISFDDINSDISDRKATFLISSKCAI